MIKIAVFASGEGTNLQALLDGVSSRRIRGQIALVVSSNDSAGALTRARRANVEAVVLRPKDFPTPEEYSAVLAAECKRRDIGLICLAGFMHQIKAPLLSAYPNRILNIHPALLPSFGGKGMYGMRVHEAVLQAGLRVSGCTVHFVDEIYDHGPIISQHPVPVLPSDTPATLAARIRAQEHFAYPEAVRLFCEGRLEIRGGVVRVLPGPHDDSPRVKRALVSVSDKEGLIDFCRGLQELGVEIVSTSGTAKALHGAGLEVRSLDSMTGFPEILQGRVKTLHPKIHGAILLRRRDPEQRREAEIFGIEPIDLVVVNLYPFAKTVAQAQSPYDREVIEQIDIGGVALIRAAAKNFEDVAVVVSPNDYAPILRELEKSQGQISLQTRRWLASAAFKHTAGYDATIGKAWNGNPPHPGPLPERAGESENISSPAGGDRAKGSTTSRTVPAADICGREGGEREQKKFPETLTLILGRVQALRYGENPHQAAALYKLRTAPDASAAKSSFEQIHGKESSYNNLLDAAGAWEAVCEFDEPAAVIFKHVTPCGAGKSKTVAEAFERAWACDPLSAFGGILAVNRSLPKNIAEELSSRFMEVIVAPAYDPEALEILKKKQNLRLLLRREPPSSQLQLRSIGSEILVTEPDRKILEEFKTVTRRAPTPEEEQTLRFAWTISKHVRSNAIVLAGTGATVGIGAGQMSRVDAVQVAGMKFREYLKKNKKPEPLALASDAFFPFRDGIDAAASLGATAIIQPGGSVRDAEVIAAADEHKIAMIFTGMRHFKH